MKLMFQNYNDSRVIVGKCKGRSLTDSATRLAGGVLMLNDYDQS